MTEIRIAVCFFVDHAKSNLKKNQIAIDFVFRAGSLTKWLGGKIPCISITRHCWRRRYIILSCGFPTHRQCPLCCKVFIFSKACDDRIATRLSCLGRFHSLCLFFSCRLSLEMFWRRLYFSRRCFWKGRRRRCISDCWTGGGCLLIRGMRIQKNTWHERHSWMNLFPATMLAHIVTKPYLVCRIFWNWIRVEDGSTKVSFIFSAW